VLIAQGILPLNPDANPSMTADLAFNTAISFVVNCNLQHYSGETGLSYLSQMMLMFLQFVSAGTGIAAAVLVFNAMKEQTGETIGNFYCYLVKSCTRILLPLSLIIALVLVLRGVPMTFEGKDHFTSLQGDNVQVSRGPAAAFVAIKHLGTNGGGFFGANSAHPLENPDYLTNAVCLWAQLIIPFALIFAMGYYLRRKRLSYMMFAVMTVGFLLLAVPTMISEASGNPAIAQLGISQHGAMEGKEVRFGAAMTGFWSIATTVISTGSVNGMHDSMMPVSTTMQLLGMMVNCFYGGCGVGLLNFYIFIILAVFISGLMVGRTPEFLGKKIEAKEVKIAAFIAILHPLLILSGTALAAYVSSGADAVAWVANPGSHGFSEMLYEFTSSAANNGSGLEGLADNNWFWNTATGRCLKTLQGHSKTVRCLQMLPSGELVL
ncbi:MAG: potassium-transporting ATPase subunit A, partial [Sphingobacteriales bacterium]